LIYGIRRRPATETSSPGFNSNGGEVAVYLITVSDNCADKGESHTPAVKGILLGELLITVEIIFAANL
jgi:hypothetical protein